MKVKNLRTNEIAERVENENGTYYLVPSINIENGDILVEQTPMKNEIKIFGIVGEIDDWIWFIFWPLSCFLMFGLYKLLELFFIIIL